LFIQTAFGIGQHPLILTSNSKHTQTVEFKLEANSFSSWNWNLEANSIPSSILCIQTHHKFLLLEIIPSGLDGNWLDYKREYDLREDVSQWGDRLNNIEGLQSLGNQGNYQ
jgi:hypothetical protein